MAIVKKSTTESVTVADTVPVVVGDSPATPPISQDARQRQIQRSGVIQAVVQSQAVFSHTTSFNEWFKLCEETADRMLAYIQKV